MVAKLAEQKRRRELDGRPTRYLLYSYDHYLVGMMLLEIYLREIREIRPPGAGVEEGPPVIRDAPN
jgi:hypothetical protein